MQQTNEFKWKSRIANPRFLVAIPTPDNIAEEYQDEFDSVSYNPETGKVKYKVNKKYFGKYSKMLQE